MTRKQAATQTRTVLIKRGDYVLLEIYEKTIQAMQARILELDDMLAAVGAGGVEPLKPQPQGKPATDYQVEQLAHRTCWRYRHSSDPAHSHTYTFNRHTLLEFARALRDGGAA